MNDTEEFLLSLIDRAGEDCIAVNGKCQHCGALVELDVDYVDKAIVVNGNGGMRYYVSAGKPCFLCSDCNALGRRLGSPTEVYSRVVGYLSPVKRWNRGKLAEWEARKPFTTDFQPDITTV